jgi:glycosyltransferase involved in cell wall biosynthesis
VRHIDDAHPSSDRPAVLFAAVPAAMGGSNRSLATVLECLQGAVHRVVAVRRSGPFVDLVKAKGLSEELIDLPGREHGSRGARVWSAFRILQWSIPHRVTIAAIHANALTGLNMVAPTAILLRLPVVVWVHDPVGSRWGRRLGPIIRRLIPDLRVVAVSRTAEAVAVENGLCSPGVPIVPNPIDPADVLANGVEPSSRIRIGVLGGATERKGFDLLPAVAAQLQDMDLEWHLYVGLKSGEALSTVDSLTSTLGATVVTHGRDPDVRNAYARCDIVFCPSRAESFCRVAAEAMLNGIPVVASDIEPLRALLGDDEAGILFPVDDTAAAAAAIRHLATDSEARVRLGEAGKLRASAFSPHAVASALAELYVR